MAGILIVKDGLCLKSPGLFLCALVGRLGAVALMLALGFNRLVEFFNIVLDLVELLVEGVGVVGLVFLAAVGLGGFDAQLDEVGDGGGVLAGGHSLEVALQVRDLTDYFLHFII